MTAQPAPYPGDTTPLPIGTHRLERTFTDAVGNGLSGDLTATPTDRHDTGDAVVAAIPFPVKVRDGVLSVDLPAGTYSFTGNLQGPGGRVRETFTITVETP